MALRTPLDLICHYTCRSQSLITLLPSRSLHQFSNGAPVMCAILSLATSRAATSSVVSLHPYAPAVGPGSSYHICEEKLLVLLASWMATFCHYCSLYSKQNVRLHTDLETG